MSKKVYRKDLTIKSNDPQWKKFVDYYNQWWEEKFKEKGYFKYTMRFDDVHIISKRMGFIEWLVYRQKINREKTELSPITELVLLSGYGIPVKRYEIKKRYRMHEQLIMILSIQENPITFILGILE